MIIAVRMDPTWMYLSCHKCFSGVLPDDSNKGVATSSNSTSVAIWKCKKCDLTGVDVVRRFRIQVRVQDPTGIVSLTLFDRDVSGAINKSAEEIYAKLPKGEEEDTLPPELNVLVGRTYAFKIDVAEFNVRNKYHVYTVSKMTNIKDVLGELVDVNAFVEGTQPELASGVATVATDEDSSHSVAEKCTNSQAGLEDPNDGKKEKLTLVEGTQVELASRARKVAADEDNSHRVAEKRTNSQAGLEDPNDGKKEKISLLTPKVEKP